MFEERRSSGAHHLAFCRHREEEEDKLIGAMLKKKGRTEGEGGREAVALRSLLQRVTVPSLWSPDFHKDPHGEQQKKKGTKFKPMKVLKRLSHKGEPGKSPSKDKSP